MRTEIHGQIIDGRVDVTEMMGNERFPQVIVSGQKLLARVDARTRARSGQDVSLLLDIDRVHLFGAESQEALDKIDLPELAGLMPDPL